MPGWGEVRQRRWGSGGDEREQGEREEGGQRSGLSHLTPRQLSETLHRQSFFKSVERAHFEWRPGVRQKRFILKTWTKTGREVD